MDFSNYWFQSAQTPGPTGIGNSLRFRGQQYLHRVVPARASVPTAVTVSYWFKKSDSNVSNYQYVSEAGYASNQRTSEFFNISSTPAYGPADAFCGLQNTPSGVVQGSSTAPLRDPSAWYHVVTTYSGDANTGTRKIYLNGEEVDSDTYSQASLYPWFLWYCGTTVATQVIFGGSWFNSSFYFNGYLAEVYAIDGQALDPTEFGEYNENGVWIPKAYTGAYGANGFYLDFSDRAFIGRDSSGNNNNFTNHGFNFDLPATSDYDQMEDSPTQNWATLNAVDVSGVGNLHDANLACGTNIGADTSGIRATQAVSSGKWYFEVTGTSVGNTNIQAGWASTATAQRITTSSNNVFGMVINPGSTHMVALDCASNAIWTGENGVWDNGATLAEIESGDTTNARHSNVAGYPVAPMFLDQASSLSGEAALNYGQKPFNYTLPTGFNPVQTKNLPAAPIRNGRDHFQAIVGVGDEAAELQPNLRKGTYVPDLYTATNSGSNHTNPVQNKWGGMASAAFNGSIATSNGTEGSGTRIVGDVVVFSPSTPITVNTSLRIYTRNYLGGATFGINGADRTALPAIGNNGASTYGWADLSFTGTLTELTLRDQGTSRTLLFAIEVDGEILYDKQNVGTWSPYLFTSTASGNTYSATLAKSFGTAATGAFDNRGYWSSSSYSADTSGTNMFLVFQPSTPIMVETSLRVWTRNYQGNAHYSINRADKVDMPTIVNNGASEYGWADLNFTGELSEFGIQDGTGAATRLMAIEIDGKILVDGGILNLAQTAFPNGLWWIKDRANDNQHQLVDSVRGGNQAMTTPACVTGAYAAPVGNSVAWCWNFDDPTVNGFDIQQTTGSGSQNHNLGAVPDLIITGAINRLGAGGNPSWRVYHTSIGTSACLLLNSSDPKSNHAERVTAVSDTSFTYTGIDANYIHYLFKAVPGYSAFGSYTGNGDPNGDGPFIYTEFRPAWVMVKNVDTGNNNWIITDSTRDAFNPCGQELYANSADDETTFTRWDFLSNGFKVRSDSSASSNANGNTYVYAAFAENPFGGSNVAPVTAR